MAYCLKQTSGRQEQPWVEDIRDRYGYLAQREGAGEAARTDLYTNLR